MGEGVREVGVVEAERRRLSVPPPSPPYPLPTSTSPSTFRAYSADEQLCSTTGPPGRGQHRQAPRGALAHEQSHFAENSTLMQPEPASQLWV
jgi:hypothetical protein